MKRIISILMVVAMMLSALLAVIPASAEEGTEPAPVTYKVNWKRHYDKGWMRNQWYKTDSDAENAKFGTYFTADATNDSLSLTPKGNGNNFTYYSKNKMIELKDSTHFEYTFLAKNNIADKDAGVIFAYDVTGKLPYFAYGIFGQTTKLVFRRGHDNSGQDNSRPDITVNNDSINETVLASGGFGQYKVEYIGFTVKFYVMNSLGQYSKVGSDITLPAGSKVCFGVYSTDQKGTVTIKDCVLTAIGDDVTKGNIAIAAIDEAIEAGDALVANKNQYTATSYATFEAALTAANTAKEGTDVQAKVAATATLEAAIAGLKVKADTTALDAAIAKAEAIRVGDYTNGAALTEKIDAAKALKAEAEPDQTAVDNAVNAIEDAIKALTSKKKNLLYLGEPNKVVEMGNKGEGNVSYIDYHKYVADKKYTPGGTFTTDLKAANDTANYKYVLRLADNNDMSGEGTSEAIDGVVHTASRFSHQVNDRVATINGIKYDHAFGYSFKKAVTADEIAFYLPENTNIKSIDVYGAITTTVDGTVLYGKAVDGEVAAPRTLLGTFDVTKATVETTTVGTTTYKYKVVRGYLTEARKLEYIFFALTLDANDKGAYAFNEIELYGIDNPADFSKLSAQMDIYHNLESYKSEYTTETWAKVEEAITANKKTIESVFSAQNAINDAATAIETAIKGLALAKAADKKALDEAIKAADAIVAEKAKYKEDNWAAFTVALKNAKDVSSGTVYSQKAVDEATSTLKNVMQKLSKIGDKTALKAAIDTAKTYTKDKYSGDTMKWKLFEKALGDAEAVYADESADQAAVDEAKADLEAAQAKLVLATPEEGDDDKGGKEDTDKEGESAEGEIIEEEVTTEVTEAVDESTAAGKKKKCGSSVAVSALAIVGVLGTAVVIKKKED